MSSKTVLNRQSAIVPETQKEADAQPSRLFSLFVGIRRSLSKLLLGSREPKIWQVRDRSGNILWCAYDPLSGRSLTYANEEAVRIWLEQLHLR